MPSNNQLMEMYMTNLPFSKLMLALTTSMGILVSMPVGASVAPQQDGSDFTPLFKRQSLTSLEESLAKLTAPNMVCLLRQPSAILDQSCNEFRSAANQPSYVQKAVWAIENAERIGGGSAPRYEDCAHQLRCAILCEIADSPEAVNAVMFFLEKRSNISVQSSPYSNQNMNAIVPEDIKALLNGKDITMQTIADLIDDSDYTFVQKKAKLENMCACTLSEKEFRQVLDVVFTPRRHALAWEDKQQAAFFPGIWHWVGVINKARKDYLQYLALTDAKGAPVKESEWTNAEKDFRLNLKSILKTWDQEQPLFHNEFEERCATLLSERAASIGTKPFLLCLPALQLPGKTVDAKTYPFGYLWNTYPIALEMLVNSHVAKYMPSVILDSYERQLKTAVTDVLKGEPGQVIDPEKLLEMQNILASKYETVGFVGMEFEDSLANMLKSHLQLLPKAASQEQ